MFNTIYRLVAPRKFEICFNNITLDTNKVLVRPTYLSICNADQRYYQGLRTPNILRKKLPLALIHEGIGKIIYDPLNRYKSGQVVIMIPNEPCESSNAAAGNYIRTSKFRGSSIDGFLQENILLDESRILPLSVDINLDIAAFTEFVSVSVHSISRFNKKAHSIKDTIGIWGDGNLGFVTALLLKYLLPESKIIVIGVNYLKLEKFTFADVAVTADDLNSIIKIDHAFECVGGAHSQTAINQIIDIIEPEGTISILGVSEYNVPLNTRMILEKGLTVIGSSRSERQDFEKVMEIYKKYTEIPLYLSNIVNAEIEINSIKDIETAFEWDINKEYGKTIMKWNI